jgi:hypothetical protein
VCFRVFFLLFCVLLCKGRNDGRIDAMPLLAAGESLLPRPAGAFLCPRLFDYKQYEYRLVQILQQTQWRSAFKNAFGFLRSQLGRWSNQGKKLAWHWGIQIKRRNEPGNTYCTVGLRKTKAGGTELTSPDVYDSARCWRPGAGSKGCDAYTQGMEWTPLTKVQARILDLVLRKGAAAEGKYGDEVKRFELPFKFSYMAHLGSGSGSGPRSLYNCNRFANHFHRQSQKLLKALTS